HGEAAFPVQPAVRRSRRDRARARGRFLRSDRPARRRQRGGRGGPRRGGGAMSRLPRTSLAVLLFVLAGCGDKGGSGEPLPADYTDWYRVDTYGPVSGHGDTYRIIYANDFARLRGVPVYPPPPPDAGPVGGGGPGAGRG